MSEQILASIERELKLINLNMAEANDIATLAAYSSIPATLDDESRKALRRLRDRVMQRAKDRAES